jgi:hypothetical protein
MFNRTVSKRGGGLMPTGFGEVARGPGTLALEGPRQSAEFLEELETGTRLDRERARYRPLDDREPRKYK